MNKKMKTKAVVMWDGGGMNIAIPKKNRDGYLKAPLGHHYNAIISDIENSEHVDACGLDGYLQFDYGYTSRDRRKEITSRVMPQLAVLYGFKSWKTDTAEFWRIFLPDKKTK